MVIAIDGPAGTGKSTIAHKVADDLGKIIYLNSGSFYRAITLALIESSDFFKNDRLDLSDSEKILEFAKKQKLDYTNGRMILNDTDVENLLHQDKIDANVSQLSSIVPVRHFVNERLRQIVKNMNVICEGRDITTVVFPDAEYKFYLDASIDVQARRRFNQGVSNLSFEEIKKSIIERDKMDKNKAEGSLKIAKDAFYIDTSDLTIDEVCAIIENKINLKGTNYGE